MHLEIRSAELHPASTGFRRRSGAPLIRDAQVRVLPPGLRVLANSDSYMRRFESCRPSQPVRSLWAASLALSDSDQQPRQIGGMSSAAFRTARGSSGFPGLCRTCVPLEGHRDLLRRLVGSRPRCQVRWRIGFRVAGSRRISSSMKRQAFCIASIRVPSL